MPVPFLSSMLLALTPNTRDDGRIGDRNANSHVSIPQLDERLKREGVKTHKERVEELNRYLSNLSEHHDM